MIKADLSFLVLNMKSQNLNNDFEERLQTQTGQSHPLHQQAASISVLQISAQN
ncbi:MAG: hypothetical protein LBQ98_03270 [Nitrososphaerota archaeon]|jgi:hypothetical protein|nr:hypothetical protein [Nitrososphaerota archaeon]